MNWPSTNNPSYNFVVNTDHRFTSYFSDTPILPSGILIHAISARHYYRANQYDLSTIAKMLETLSVSAHNLIGRDGEIWELVQVTRRAWHAGKSRHRDYTNLNYHFIGIEVVGRGDEPFEYMQYKALAWLCNNYMQRYSIATHMIQLHQIASDSTVRPDPKWDPGTYFDWVNLGIELAKLRG